MTSPPAKNATAGETVKRILFLDVLRAIACLMVVFYHSAVNIGIFPYVIWGVCGVHLFFVLSGYLLAVPYCKALLSGTSLPSIRLFYSRRIIRVLPPYLIALGLFILLRMVTGSKVPSADNIVSHLFLVFNYGSDQEFFSINPVFWTLAIEVQFYLFLPIFMAILAHFVTRSNLPRSSSVLAGLLLLLFVGIGTRAFEFYLHGGGGSSPNESIKFKSFLAFLDLFVMGMLVAFLKHLPESHVLRRVSSYRLIGSGLFLIVSANLWLTIRGGYDWMTVTELGTAMFFPILVAAGFACVLLAHVLAPERTDRLLHIPALAWVGQISYSIYLYHVGIQAVVWKIFDWKRYIADFSTLAVVNAFTALPVILLVSYVMYRLVEQPTLAWMSILAKRKVAD